MNFERIKKRGPVSKEYVGQKSAGKGVRHAFYSFLRTTFFLFYTVLYRIKLGQTFWLNSMLGAIFERVNDLESFPYRKN